MKKLINTLFLSLVLYGTNTFYSQTKGGNTLRIFVKDTANRPIAGAFIFIDGIKQKKKTNISGFLTFKYQRTPQKISVFSPIFGIQNAVYKGKKYMVVAYNKSAFKTNIAFTKPPNQQKNKVLNNNEYQYRDIYEYLRGRFAGVVVSSDNSIVIRGIGTFNATSEPLFILNGAAVSTVQDIAPSDVESITVIKGPESARYGVRGANGVIIIKTY